MEREEAVSLVQNGNCLQWKVCWEKREQCQIGRVEAECDKLEYQQGTLGLDMGGNRESLKIHEKKSDG